MFGQACFAPGEAKNTYGTGAFLLANVGDAPVASRSWAAVDGALAAGRAAARPPTRSRAPCSSPAPRSSGCATACGPCRSADEVEALMRGVEDTGGVYLVPAFVGLGAPYWDPRARGLLIGLTRGTGLPEIARATIESIAYQVSDVVEAMAADRGGAAHRAAGRRRRGRATTTCCSSRPTSWASPVERPRVTETTALGRGVAGRPRGRVLGVARRAGGDPGRRPAVRARDGRRPTAHRRCSAAGTGRSSARRTGRPTSRAGASDAPP